MPAEEENRRIVRSRRITRACDYCHRRSIRCRPSGTASRCANCLQFDQPCTYDRESKKRGIKPKQRASHASVETPSQGREQIIDRTMRQSWNAPVVASQAVVMDLVEIYFEIVYPIFPFFHRPTYIRKISRGDYNKDRNLFAATMAVCALVSARVQDQALFNPAWDVQELAEPDSEVFYGAAIQAAEDGEKRPQDLNSLRACALLALAAIQHGRIREMQEYLGKYHTLVAMDGLHDESNWPEGMGIVEIEERRRLFWSMYTLEVYTSIIWSGITRIREEQVSVAYTIELDDEMFSDRGYNQQIPSPIDIGPSPGGSWGEVRSSSWLCGWNFTTSLYRVMEHVITKFRDRDRRKRPFLNDMFGDQDPHSESSIRDYIMRLYSALPRCFKECPEISCDPSADRYGFQAANIIATVQLLRMMLFASGGGSVEERCKIASEVVEAFSSIPVAYLRATSSPLLHHLAGIGMILGRVFDEPISGAAYQQVRDVLLALAQLLENLDHGMHSATNAQRLRDLVTQTDSWMGSRIQLFPGRDITNTPISSPNVTSEDSEASRTIPLQLTTDFFEGWPWNLEFMQFAGS